MTKRPLMPRKSVRSRKSDGSASGTASPLAQERGKGSRQLAKSADPDYMKFTTYVRKTTHLSVKTRLVSKERELSDLVEDLLFNWLKQNDNFT